MGEGAGAGHQAQDARGHGAGLQAEVPRPVRQGGEQRQVRPVHEGGGGGLGQDQREDRGGVQEGEGDEVISNQS